MNPAMVDRHRTRHAFGSRHALFALLLASFAPSCGKARPASEPTLTLEPVFRIGEPDGATEVAFGQIYTVQPLPGGGFLTCDLNDMMLRRYDRDGRFVASIGRRGAGPGEYAACIDVAVLRDSSLLVSDPPNGRFVEFGSDGRFVRVIHAAISGGLGGGGTFLVDAADRIWKKAWLPAEGVGESDIPSQFVILDRTGRRVDSVHVPSPGGGDAGYAVTVCATDACYSSQPPDSLYAVDRTGAIALTSPRRYSIEVRRVGAAPLIIRRDVEPVAYGSEERGEWAAYHERQTRMNPDSRWAAISDAKPFIRDMRFDDTGRLWVQVHVVAEKREVTPLKEGEVRPRLTWQERNTYDLFAPSGGFLGRLQLAQRTELMGSLGDRVWLLEEGMDGVQRIGVYELRGMTDGQ